MASLAKSSIIFALMTMISRALGLLRDILIARFFDAAITDPFFAALRIPNTLRRFFAEGSFANAFVPVFSETKVKHPEQLKALFSQTLGTLLVILVLVSLVGVLSSSWIIYTIAHGLTEKTGQYEIADHMLKIMFPYILFISVTAMFSGVLNAFGKFALPALVPVFLNLALIAASLWGHFLGRPTSGIELAWAVLVGGIVQATIQIPILYRLDILSMPKWGWYSSQVRKILRLMLPTLFGSSVGQLSILINTFLASGLMTGSISWLYYSDRMVELPIALVGVALGTVILPRLSALRSRDDDQRFTETLSWALKWALIVGLAASTGLFMLAPAILMTLFYGGHFNLHDVLMTTESLRAYSAAALFLIVVKVLVPAFYARQDTKTPVIAGIIAIAVNIIMAIILSHFFAHVGLAMAGAISSMVNVGLLLFFLNKSAIKIKGLTVMFALKIGIANLLMLLLVYGINPDYQVWASLMRWERFMRIILIVVAAVLFYGATLYLMGIGIIKPLKRGDH